MTNTKCIKINNDTLERLNVQFNKELKINELQTYFPILSLFFEVYNDSKTNFVLNSNFLVSSLLEPINYIKTDSYIKYFFKANILNQSNNETFDKNIFIKILPILNVSKYMMNEYNVTNNKKLPNIHSSLTSKKINNYNNSAYIDAFFSYLGSILTEKGKCPTFPLFFGTFTGIADEFKEDISEEFNSMKNTTWFNKNVNKHFKIHNIDIDQPNHFGNELNIDHIEHINTSDIDIDINDSLENEQSENEHSGDNDSLENEHSETGDNDSLENEQSETGDNDSLENEPSDNAQSGDNDSLENAQLDNDENSYNSDNDSIKSNEHMTIDDMNIYKCETLSLDSNSNFSLNSCDTHDINYCCINDYPVQINCIEMLEYTLDNYIDKSNNNINEIEWKSILFQISFGLSVAQKQYDFVHNDLHSSNIMFKETEMEYLYYNFKGTCFKIPTFGKIVKIIDFGRATFSYKNRIFFSDVFKKNGDAEGQYSYPYLNNLNKCKIKPNKSFDLSRLATTIIEHFEEDSNIYKLLKLWCTDKYGNFLNELEDDFNLYRIIAKNVKSAVPKNQINKLIFKEFTVEKDSIKNEYIYNY